MTTPSGADPAPIDFGRLTAEINAEVRRRRASGDFPPGLERELDGLFAQYAPVGTGGEFSEVMEGAERASFIHADVPTASNRAGVAYVKRGLSTAMGFYLRFLAHQVTAFAGAITRAVRLLGERVDALERVTVRAAAQTLAEIDERRAGPDLNPWLATVTDAIGSVRGRILHAECGRGELVGHLAHAGLDAYGIEPIESVALAGARAGLDVRADDVLGHLAALPDASLGALVLSGCVDALPLGDVLVLADLARAKVSHEGMVVVISAGPAAWVRSRDPVVADLSPGRPLHPDTWTHLFGSRHFRVDAVHDGPAPERLTPVPSGAAGADTINANIERLNALLFSPASYAVVATRIPA